MIEALTFKEIKAKWQAKFGHLAQKDRDAIVKKELSEALTYLRNEGVVPQEPSRSDIRTAGEVRAMMPSRMSSRESISMRIEEAALLGYYVVDSLLMDSKTAVDIYSTLASNGFEADIKDVGGDRFFISVCWRPR